MMINNNNDKFLWEKLITLLVETNGGYTSATGHHFDYIPSTHLVTCYENKHGRKYYLFDYLDCANNGKFVMGYNKADYDLLKQHIEVRDDIEIYAKDLSEPDENYMIISNSYRYVE
ncbi:hypothetical protein [Clostridium tunisiense]|uniref:hypothetical protein n=1 Tax=Clostridium tunisiense TaxID=219748 RepID=UPI0012FE16C5|nr:hypothetical protein [Clostridium tunisiense]